MATKIKQIIDSKGKIAHSGDFSVFMAKKWYKICTIQKKVVPSARPYSQKRTRNPPKL